MVTKLKKTAAPEASGANIGGSVKDSAQQIWQAGLGAFAKAQAEGTRAFEALVKEGTTLQRKTQAAAEEKISEATNRMSNMATDISSKATGHWDKLESIFEERVAKALNKLGVPSAKDINALIALGVCTVYFAMYFGVPLVMLRLAERSAAPSHPGSLRNFLNGDVETNTGRVSGWGAMAQLLTIPVGLTGAFIAFGIIIRLGA